VAGDEILHVGIAECARDRKHAVDAVVENEATGAGHTSALVLVAALVIVREAQGAAVPTEHNARIAHVGRVEDPLPARLRPQLCLDLLLAGGSRVGRIRLAWAAVADMLDG